MTDTVKVLLRIRPYQPLELNDLSSNTTAVTCTSDQTCTSIQSASDPPLSFTFDAVCGPDTTQEQIYERVGAPVVHAILNGFNATIFAYGQTGSGKTHTCMGPITDPGLTRRIVQNLYNHIETRASSTTEFTISCSFLEIYMERVRDLLNPVASNLQIRESVTKGLYVENASVKYVVNVDEVMSLIATAQSQRATAATNMNQTSSRSHSVFLMDVSQKDSVSGVTKTSKLNLVDLAGSEMVKKSGATGSRLEEAQAINYSLSALGNVIFALTDSHATYVPFRDSKLTRLLQESLGGNSKTWLIINCSPALSNASESLSTLRFGARAKLVKTKAVMNRQRSAMELETLLKNAERIIAAQARRIEELEALLKEHDVEIPTSVVESDEKVQEEVLANGLTSSELNGDDDGYSSATAAAAGVPADSSPVPAVQEDIQDLAVHTQPHTPSIPTNTSEGNTLLHDTLTELDNQRTQNEILTGRITELHQQVLELTTKLNDATTTSPLFPPPPSLPPPLDGNSGSTGNDDDDTAGRLTPVMAMFTTTSSSTPKRPPAASSEDISPSRLERLVSVHRQLLRKYAQLEASHAESASLLANSETRIQRLESNLRQIGLQRRAEREFFEVRLAELRLQQARTTLLPNGGGGLANIVRSLRGGSTSTSQ